MKKIMILGSQGYIGFPLLNHLLNLGHDVLGIDSGIKEKQMENLGVNSLFEPISSNHTKISKLQINLDVCDYEKLSVVQMLLSLL